MTPPAATANASKTVGDILLAHGYISPEQLEDALSRQGKTGQPLGQILVESGSITRLELASALAEQWSDAPHLVRMAPATGKSGKGKSAPAPAPLVHDEPAFELGPDDAGAVEELRDHARALSARLAAVEAGAGSFGDLHERLDEVRQMVGGLADWAAGPELRLAELERRVGELATDDVLAELGARLSTGEGAIVGIAERVEQIIVAIDGAVGKLEEESKRLAGSIADLAARVELAATSEAVAEVRALADEVAARPSFDPALAEHVAVLAEKVDATASVDQLAELRALVDDVAARPTGDPALAEVVAALAARLDGLETGVRALSARVDDAAGAAEVHELRGAVAEVGARVDALGAHVEEAARASAVDELRAVVEGLAGQPAVAPEVAARLDDIVSRLDAFAAASELAELRAAVDELVAKPVADPIRVDVLSERVADLTARLDGVAVSADGKVDVSVITELRATIEEIGSRPSGDPAVAAQVAEVNALVAGLATGESLATLRTELETLSASVAAAASTTAVDELRAEIAALVDRPAGDPSLEGRLDAVVARVDALAIAPDGSVDAGVLSELRTRVDELAERPATDPSVELRLDELHAAMGRLAGDIADPQARIQALADRLTALEHAGTTPASPPPAADGAAMAELSSRLDELASRIEAVALSAAAAPAHGSAPAAPAAGGDGSEAEFDKLRVSVESLWMRMSEFQKAIGSLLDPRGVSGKLEALESRLVALETSGGAAGRVDMEDADLGEIASRIQAMESSAAQARETLLTSLEKMASTIDWRLQRLEAPAD